MNYRNYRGQAPGFRKVQDGQAKPRNETIRRALAILFPSATDSITPEFLRKNLDTARNFAKIPGLNETDCRGVLVRHASWQRALRPLFKGLSHSFGGTEPCQ